MTRIIAVMLYCLALLICGGAYANSAHADPYCFVPIGEYKNTCDPNYLWPQTSGENGVPGTFGPDGTYTPCTYLRGCYP
jgi:hypothetical protein